MTDVKQESREDAAREAKANTFRPMLASLREQLRARLPDVTAATAGVEWREDAAEYAFDFLARPYYITWPELIAFSRGGQEPCSADLQGLFLTYLSMADNTPATANWIAFRELPDGWLYHQAFQGYSGDALAAALGNDVERLGRGATALDGRRISLGDAGYVFTVLPKVHLAIVYWLGDDEFPPSAQVLFDAAAGHYLSTDGLAIVGSRLVHGLLKV